MFRLSMLVVCLFFVSTFSGCRNLIEPGYVGIKVNNYGSQKGVEDYPVLTGAVWYNPFTTTVYEYPTFTQNATWDGSEKISFNTSEGSRITCAVGLSYSLLDTKVPHIFVKHRKDLDNITHNYLRNKVRDVLNRHSAEYTAIEALGSKTQQLLEKARKDLDQELGDDGFIVDTLSFISAPAPDDPQVAASISQVINSTQRAIEAANKVKQIEAEALQEVARAEGKAQSILLEAKAQAEANKIVAESLTPELNQYKMTEKWDGKAPQVMGANTSMLMDLNK
jgi:regulator of protease activity HflC (stomatin/prohibitin superfamily)